MGPTDPPDGPSGSNPPQSVLSSETTDPKVRPADIWDRLDRVQDPELDRSIVDLQYIEEIDIVDSSVTVRFVLPTAWCSPAFAWMMATGIRDEVSALSAVNSVAVRLVDHMHGEEITTGVNERLAFESVFEEAEDGIEAVQEKLDRKSRFARQYSAIKTLLEAGLDPGQVVALRRADVDLEYREDLAAVDIVDGTLTVTVDREPLADYLSKARATGLVTVGADRLFADREGEPLSPESGAFESTLQEARLAGANIDGQATICEALHESRNGVTFD